MIPIDIFALLDLLTTNLQFSAKCDVSFATLITTNTVCLVLQQDKQGRERHLDQISLYKWCFGLFACYQSRVCKCLILWLRYKQDRCLYTWSRDGNFPNNFTSHTACACCFCCVWFSHIREHPQRKVTHKGLCYGNMCQVCHCAQQ